MSKIYDCVIVGAGIAGASLAYELAAMGLEVALVEAEAQPGYHSTGRSAAFYAETYGNETVRKLTKFSRAFYQNPPPGFCEYPLFIDSGGLFIAREDQLPQLEALYQSVKQLTSEVSLEDAEFAAARIPRLRRGYVKGCLWSPDEKEIDVAALLQGYLRLAKAGGAQLLLGQRVEKIFYRQACWHLHSNSATIAGRNLVNAAGAWADVVAEMAGVQTVGLQPKKRTVCIVPVADALDLTGMPVVVDVEEQFYFKKDAGNLLISPADETPVQPADVYSDLLDVATGVDRVARVLDIELRRVSHEWAGLRSFVEDKSPVLGFAPGAEGFFWLAGQGGYGIQMAPGLAQLAASLIGGQGVPERLAQMGFDPAAVAPLRCRY